jgi:hypothetical protein
MFNRVWKSWAVLSVVILTSLLGSSSTAQAGCKWSRVKGAVCSLDASAEKLRKRIECLEYRGPCTSIAMQLERATCRLKETIYQDAEWPIVQCALSDVKLLNSQMVSCVARSCVLREDRRLQTELQRFQDHLCRTQEQIQISLDKLRVQPGCRTPMARTPYGNPRLGNSPWFQAPSNFSYGFDERLDRGMFEQRDWQGYDNQATPMQQEWSPFQQPMTPREPLVPGPQIRVQNRELGKEMLKLVLSRVLE